MNSNMNFDGFVLKTIGINQAINNANITHENWADIAYDILKVYLENNDKDFMCEDIRNFAVGRFNLPEPPTKRAWGAIILKAKKKT